MSFFYKQYKNIFASLLTSNIKEEVSMSKIKKYDSSIGASLYRDELDLSIFDEHFYKVILRRILDLKQEKESQKINSE